MFTIDPRSPSPLYEQLIEQAIRSIARGLIRPGEQMPSVRELAGSLFINPNTVARAYQELESRGFITTMRGKGSFVADMPLALVREEALKQKMYELRAVAKELDVSDEELCQMMERIKEEHKHVDR